MKYRSCDKRLSEKFMERVFRGNESVEDGEFPTVGSGEEVVDVTELGVVLREYGDHVSPLVVKSGAQRDVYEGEVCGRVHASLTMCEQECFRALEDPGFWSYLSFRFGVGILRWRETAVATYVKTPNDKTRAAALKYVYDPKLTEGVLSRMYLRGRISAVDGDYSIAEAREYGASVGNTDVWRSHITRIVSGNAHPLARALATYWNEHEWIKTDTPNGGLRLLAKMINRRRSNILPELLDADEAKQVVEVQAAKIRRDAS